MKMANLHGKRGVRRQEGHAEQSFVIFNPKRGRESLAGQEEKNTCRDNETGGYRLSLRRVDIKFA
jgi:hypothetical protein